MTAAGGHGRLHRRQAELGLVAPERRPHTDLVDASTGHRQRARLLEIAYAGRDPGRQRFELVGEAAHAAQLDAAGAQALYDFTTDRTRPAYHQYIHHDLHNHAALSSG